IDTSGSLTCSGKVHVPVGVATPGVTADGGVVHDTFTIPQPCQCDKVPDFQGIVGAYATANDDSQFGVTPDQPASPRQPQFTLPSGHAYLACMFGDVTVHLIGRTAIFVAGDASIGALTLDLQPGAEVDLFIAKNFHIDTSFASNAAPAKVRVYIG